MPPPLLSCMYTVIFSGKTFDNAITKKPCISTVTLPHEMRKYYCWSIGEIFDLWKKLYEIHIFTLERHIYLTWREGWFMSIVILTAVHVPSSGGRVFLIGVKLSVLCTSALHLKDWKAHIPVCSPMKCITRYDGLDICIITWTTGASCFSLEDAPVMLVCPNTFEHLKMGNCL